MMGGDGLTQATKTALLTANYVAARLTDDEEDESGEDDGELRGRRPPVPALRVGVLADRHLSLRGRVRSG